MNLGAVVRFQNLAIIVDLRFEQRFIILCCLAKSLGEQPVATSLPPWAAAIVRHCPGQGSKLLTIRVHAAVQRPHAEAWYVRLEERLDLGQEGWRWLEGSCSRNAFSGE